MQMKRSGCQAVVAARKLLARHRRKSHLVAISMMERFSAVFLSIARRAGFLLERSILPGLG
ncbi:hypothetical protein GC174_09765 [bacterium]|nr:hypothetical protein [bacterium]